MILILSESGDPAVASARSFLTARGETVAVFDLAEVPSNATVTQALGPGAARRARIRNGTTCIDLDEVTAVWVRRPGRPSASHAVRESRWRDLVAYECRDQLDDIWRTLACRYLPARPDQVWRAQLKATQLAIAADLGFAIPDTLVTSDPDEFLEFCRRHEGRVVTKLASPTAMTESRVSEQFGRYTEPVGIDDYEFVESLRLCPITVQADVAKRSEIRATVVAGEVFAAEIESQRSNRARRDWRRHDPEHTPLRAYELPAEVAARCVAVVERLGLTFGAIDLIRRPDDRHVFLEVNPAGEYLWIEALTGLPITRAIADWLAQGDRP